MSPVGPELPPHLQPKRKRDDYEDSRPGTSSSSSSDSTDKRRRIVGPTLPPAPLDERPPTDATSPNDSSSEDEDGYGPSLPTAEDSTDKSNTHGMEAQTFDERDEKQDMQEKKMSRDEWMMLPPKQDDLAARMDPTKIQARGFSKSKALKGSNAAKDDDKSIWTETPEQKRKRLEYQVLGISEPSSTKTTDPSERRKTAKDDEKKVKMAQEHKEKHRGKSLLEEHKGSMKAKEEDDPSKRAFDYERDMGGGPKMGHAQRRDMIGRAGNIGSRFSQGGYL